jgi:hypothetical protein
MSGILKMRLIFFIFIFAQLFDFIAVLAEKVKKENHMLSPIKWEKIKEKKSINSERIIWKSYNDDENIFENKNIGNNQQKIKQKTLQIKPHIPSNEYLYYGDFSLSTFLTSAFDGGAGGGTGHQNYGIRFDYGLSDESLLSVYLSETDDPLYKLIEGELIPNYWASVALGYKKKIFETNNFKNSLSLATSIEYWGISSGSENKKSIYNQTDNAVGLDKHEKFIYSLSLPFSKELNARTKVSIVPGVTFIPDKLGDKNIGKNFYGNNYFLASGINLDITPDVQLLGSYTFLFGPGHNSFDENLEYQRHPIYSYGLNWNVNPIIGIEGKITNGYGSTPSTSLLTIPSDNKTLYYLGGRYTPSLFDTKFIPLKRENELLTFGGLTVNNALFPERGVSQINLNYDEYGNVFAFYGYSLSNIFQLEINTGSFNDANLRNKKHSSLQSIYLNENTFSYRFGGKLLIFSPQKNDPFWMTFRTSLGRNEGSNHQGYMFSELINTFRINNWLVFNVSPKYFFSGVESFGGIGVSSYINLLDNLQLIPEINTSLTTGADLNSTLAIRYNYSPEASVDFYYSNAAGIQDIGQLLEDKEYRFGIKLNFLY